MITPYLTQIARFMWPTWDSPGSCGPQVGPMLAPWTLLSESTVTSQETEFSWPQYVIYNSPMRVKSGLFLWNQILSVPYLILLHAMSSYNFCISLIIYCYILSSIKSLVLGRNTTETLTHIKSKRKLSNLPQCQSENNDIKWHWMLRHDGYGSRR